MSKGTVVIKSTTTLTGLTPDVAYLVKELVEAAGDGSSLTDNRSIYDLGAQTNEVLDEVTVE